MKRKSSRIKNFYKKNIEERLDYTQKFSNLSATNLDILKNYKNIFTPDLLNNSIENGISILPIPLGLATNFKINKKDYLIPMATEEPSIIAGASNAAKLARALGGFTAKTQEPIMIGQIELIKIKNINKTIKSIKNNSKKLINLANSTNNFLVNINGGAYKINIKKISSKIGNILIVELLVKVKDAMGANIVNTMLEKIAPELEKLTESISVLKIISNLAIYRTTKAYAFWKLSSEIIEKILYAQEFAIHDQFRATTQNKGIMNGISAIALATGNDTRALESGAHSFACFKQKYTPLTKYKLFKKNILKGEIEIPIQVGILGGSTQVNPMANICLKILGVKSSKELANIMASVGLAQNFAALNAMVTQGIQKGHMNLHNKKININK